MRKDVDLIRLILLQVEGETQVDVSSYGADQVNFHKALIKEGGLAEGIVGYSTAKDARPDVPDLTVLTRLTLDGHEFLNKAKSETTWAKAKDLVQRNGATLSLEAMKIALSVVIRTMLR